MRTLLISAIIILSVFTAIALACAVRLSFRRCDARPDPYFHPIGEVPGFTAEQLRAITSRSMSRIEQDAQRRSFAYGNTRLSNPRVTREMIDAAADRIPLPDMNSGRTCPPPPDADGVRHPHHSPRVHAVRNFFRGFAT